MAERKKPQVGERSDLTLQPSNMFFVVPESGENVVVVAKDEDDLMASIDKKIVFAASLPELKEIISKMEIAMNAVKA